MLIVDIYTDHRYPFLEAYDLKTVHGFYGDYFQTKIEKKDPLLKLLRRKRISYRVYDERWSRDPSCREKYLKNVTFPVRCRYCRRKLLSPWQLEVDHVVPVNKAKKSVLARRILKLAGADGINDPVNLVPSCKSCNRKKKDQMGLWTLKGFLGNHLWFWVIYYGCMISMFVFLFLYICLADKSKLVELFSL